MVLLEAKIKGKFTGGEPYFTFSTEGNLNFFFIFFLFLFIVLWKLENTDKRNEKNKN